jgi:streptomycin 6-kinase
MSRHSLVVPAGDAVLKLNAPADEDAKHEPHALGFWSGDGAVRLFDRDDDRGALLLERCRPGTRLWDDRRDELGVVGDLLPRLWGEPSMPNEFRPLKAAVEGWAEKLEAHPQRLERPLLEFVQDVYRTVDPSARFLANQDLHPANVLRAEREPWLVIDPKPLTGERELNGVGLLRNAVWLGGTAGVRHWIDALSDLGLNRDRLRGWGVAHAVAWSWGSDGEALLAAARVILDA